MPLKMKYFVLKPEGDNEHAAASREALYAYADYIRHQEPKLAEELTDWADKEQEKAEVTYV